MDWDKTMCALPCYFQVIIDKSYLLTMFLDFLSSVSTGGYSFCATCIMQFNSKSAVQFPTVHTSEKQQCPPDVHHEQLHPRAKLYAPTTADSKRGGTIEGGSPRAIETLTSGACAICNS